MKQNIIIFDGICNLCNSSVRFISKRDQNSKFTFLSQQSDEAKKLMEKYHFNYETIDTIILISNNEAFSKSDAVLEISKNLSGFWFLFSYFKIIPKCMRDFLYNFVSKNRYKFFGKTNSCKI